MTGIQSTDIKNKLHAFCVQCKNAGLKMTPQRLAIYKYLLETVEHPSADTVFRNVRHTLPNISLDTVNRTLLTLNRIGAAFVVEGTGDVKRFDANLEDHQHFKCLNCKRIIDFHHAPFDNVEIPTCIKDQFTILRKTVYFEGLCKDCQSIST
ncbi:MAG: transcriptional repressor [Phycisphaerae bacterium]|nr:transcriptional repressor [Phycisphaerae bacterium]